MIKEQNYDFRKRMSILHKPDIRDYSIHCLDNQYEVTDGSTIGIPADAGIVTVTAARDLVDYLFDSMNISARIIKGTTSADILLLEDPLDLEEANGYKGYRIDVNDNIQISAFDERGAAQAFYRLEEMMSFEKAPYVNKGIIKSRPLFSPRMVHSGFGLDMYPDSHLAQIAHAGRDAILIFVNDLYITPYGYLDFNDLIRRAKKFGIDVYAYSYIRCSKHPDDSDAQAYYDASFGKLFKSCPELKGLILVGESMFFPSKDGRMSEFHPKLFGKPRQNFWPCNDYPQLLNMIKSTVRKYNADADIVFWTYNWGMVDKKPRVELIQNLPPDISLQATFEMFEEFKHGDSTQYCSDYTISRTGPGDYFKGEAIAAKKRNLRLYTMCNTAGRTWDLGVVPYIPSPYQWIKRFERLKDARTNWGLCGLMESHHFGFSPSVISELSKWAFTTEEIDIESILEKIIARDYGNENIEKVKTAFKLWSDAITYCTPTIEDQYGPLRIGPAYPLCFDVDEAPPSVPYAHFGMSICRPMYPPKNYHHSSFSSVRLPDELKSFETMHSLMNEGVDILKCIENKTEELERLIALGSYIASIAQTTTNVKRWNMTKTKLYGESDREKALSLVEDLQKIASQEIENAQNIIWAAQTDSGLGWEPSMEYLGDEEHILWKIEQVKRVRDIRLEEFKVCLSK